MYDPAPSQTATPPPPWSSSYSSADPREARRPGKAQPAARVLVVDDEAGTREGFERILRLAAYDVGTAASEEDAVALLGKNDFDVILLDLRLHGTVDDDSGLDLLPQPRSLATCLG